MKVEATAPRPGVRIPSLPAAGAIWTGVVMTPRLSVDARRLQFVKEN
jgi:hypothetical protein